MSKEETKKKEFKVIGTKAYRLGIAAYGTENVECPYQFGSADRQRWWTGYYHERVRVKVGAILERYGLTWPN
jgi:hypothetical protein